MGLFDILAALSKVSQERKDIDETVHDFAAIDPVTGQKAFAADPRPLPPQPTPYMTDVRRAARGQITSVGAARLGAPEIAGLTREALADALSLQREKRLQDQESRHAMGAQQNLESKRANDELKKRRQEIYESLSSPKEDQYFKAALQIVAGRKDPRHKKTPDLFAQDVQATAEALKKARAGKALQPSATTKEQAPAGMKTKEEIIAAFKDGRINRAQGKAALQALGYK